ncbi:MAG: polyprenyl synthetase family protein [Pirellulales bacterium]
MSRVADKREVAWRGLKSLYAPIQGELDAVEEMLRAELRSQFPFIDQLVEHGFCLGGKRLRPALVLLSGKASGAVGREHLVLAAAVEIIHTATLIHDDVLDEAMLRRHVETVNARWGNETSVLLGDYMFSRAMHLVTTLDSMFACRSLGRTTNIVCQGELRQIENRANYDLAEAEYLEIIEAKTAELCACCCELGSHYAGADAAAQDALTRFGRSLGVAFQIADDLLDVVGDETSTGKSLGTDLEKEKPTLPLIRLLAETPAAGRAELVRLLSNPAPGRRESLRARLDGSEALASSRETAARYAQQAREELADLPETPALAALRELPEFVVSRRG